MPPCSWLRPLFVYSVLDRLNPLLEPGGVLLLTECGTPGGEGGSSEGTAHRVIRPHPNFRLFLTVDPACGEISRAMRNRCVEIFLMDTGVDTDSGSHEDKGPTAVTLERLTSGAGLVGAACSVGLRATKDVLQAVDVHVRVGRSGSDNGAVDGTLRHRTFDLLSELVVASKRRGGDERWNEVFKEVLHVAYPDLIDADMITPSGATNEVGVYKGLDLAWCLRNPGWRELSEAGPEITACAQSRILLVALSLWEALSGNETMGQHEQVVAHIPSTTRGSGVYSEAGDGVFFTLGRMDEAPAAGISWSTMLVLHAVSMYARRTCSGDAHLRPVIASRLALTLRSKAAQAVPGYVDSTMALLFESSAWARTSIQWRKVCHEAGSGEQTVDEKAANKVAGGEEAFAFNYSSPWYPRDQMTPASSQPVSRLLGRSQSWGAFSLSVTLYEAMASRAPLLVLERLEMAEARSRIKSGRVSEVGLSWLGLSLMASEGGWNLSRSRASGESAHTRLARSSLVPHLMPLLRVTDAIVDLRSKGLVQEAGVRCAGDDSVENGESLELLTSLIRARDVLVGVVLTSASTASSRHGVPGEGRELSGGFPWDSFRVAWDGFRDAMGKLKWPPPASEDRETVEAGARAQALVTRVDKALEEHAGGRMLRRDTLWERGPRAHVPATEACSRALYRLETASRAFELFVDHWSVRNGESLTLVHLLSSAHPALFATKESRAELLEALSTLYWATSSGREAEEDVGRLVQTLPEVVEESLKMLSSQHESCRGVKLLTPPGSAGAPEHRVEQVEARFDDFEAEEAARIVASATFLVESNATATSGAGASAVLSRWAQIQLSPVVEHWVCVEECSILVDLHHLHARLREDAAQKTSMEGLMHRVDRLVSCMLVTRSLAPSVAWPYQTIRWALEKSDVASMALLLSRLLPVAMDCWGKRLWHNLFRSPQALSFQLGPPQMGREKTAGNEATGGRDAREGALSGPSQMFTLVRTSVLLHLSSTAAFHGAVPPKETAMYGHGDEVDMTLINASARLEQFRKAMRVVRDMRPPPQPTLRSLAEMAWMRLQDILCAYDRSDGRERQSAGSSFKEALGSSDMAWLDPPYSSSRAASAWVTLESRLRSAMERCPDERLRNAAEDLVVPCARHILHALAAVKHGGGQDTGKIEGMVGLAVTMCACLNFELLLPSTPIDPGLRPALEKTLVDTQLEHRKCDLIVRRWASRLEGNGDISEQVR